MTGRPSRAATFAVQGVPSTASCRVVDRPRRHAAYLAKVLGSHDDPRRPLDLVWFAGGGGSSQGFRQAMGRDPDYALNHNPTALRMHEVNHPRTTHLFSDAFAASPLELEPGRPIGSMWFSPDCTHHSKARGSAPKSKRIRGLAWCVIPWAKLRRPAVIYLENVEEFVDWGPLYPEGHVLAGRAIPERKGETFRRFVRRLQQCGYVVEWRERRACNSGAPTIRKRFFMVARCDGKPIEWPSDTHAPRALAEARGLKPWRAAHEALDLSIHCPSIFMTQAEARAEGRNIKRPLVKATRRRIARGYERYVAAAAEPFMFPITHHGDSRVYSLHDPLRTVTSAHRGEFALAAPTLLRTDMHKSNAGCAFDARAPINTITSAGGFAVGAAYLVPRFGERDGQEPRSRSVIEPYPTVVPDGNGGQLVAAYLQRQFGSTVSGRSMLEPHPTVMTEGAGGKSGVVAAYLDRAFSRSMPQGAEEPLRTLTGCAHDGLVAAYLTSYYRTGAGSAASDPMRSLTGEDRHALVAAWMEQANTGMVGHAANDPLSTLVGRGTTQRLIEARLQAIGAEPGSRRRQVLDFLWEHFGEPDDTDWADPTGTLQARLRFGLVIVAGEVFEVADIGMRMLTVRELFNAQGFPPDYIIDRDIAGKPISGTAATLMCGNSVSPVEACALYAANSNDRGDDRQVAA